MPWLPHRHPINGRRGVLRNVVPNVLVVGVAAVWETLARRRALRATIFSLVTLLIYLALGRVLFPGFTDYWGYHIAQLSFYITVALVGEVMYRHEGGLFGAPTLAFAVAVAYADVIGTVADYYSTIMFYDKVVHFLGSAAFTAVVLDIMLARNARKGAPEPASRLIVLGVVLGITAGITWEFYEYIGDVIFNSGRVQSQADTRHDIIFDIFGALLMGTIAALRIWPIEWRMGLPQQHLADAPVPIEHNSPDTRSN